MASQLLDGRFRGETDAGLPLIGGMLYTYASGTTTPKVAYTDSTLGTATTNPLVLNARGEAQVWLGTGAYSLKLTDPAGVTIWTADGVNSADVAGAGQAAADALRTGLASNAAGKGADLVAVYDSLAGAVARNARQWLQDGPVSVLRFGADPTGVADSSGAINYALQASKDVVLPPGKFKVASPLIPQSGGSVQGAGRGMDPYHDGGAAGYSGTEIVVVSGIGFNLAGKSNVSISGVAIKSITNGNSQSAYGAAPAYQSGVIGIDITNTHNVQIDGVSFHGLQYGVAASSTTNGGEAAFWLLDNWVANDCLAVVKIGNDSTSSTIARDFAIRGCEIALHCGAMFDINYADGVRVENCRLFQAKNDSITIKNSQFPALSALTVFEAGGRSIVLDSCSYPVLSGVTASRAGGYTTSSPWQAKDAISVNGCTGVAIQGVIEHPGGRAIRVTGCAGVTINVSVDTPYYTNGLPVVADNASAETFGAISIGTSTAVNVTGSMNTQSVTLALSCDNASAHETTGTLAVGPFAGTYRAPNVSTGNGMITMTIPADVVIAAGGSSQVGAGQVLVPAGKSVYSRSARISSRLARVRSGSAFFTANLTDDGDGYTSFQKALLYTNSSGSAIWYSVPLQIYNQEATPTTVSAGAKLVLSVGIE